MRFLRRVFSGRRLDAELDRELRFHVEEETRRLERDFPPAEARRRALAAFGGIDPMREATRDARGLGWFEDLWRDLGFAARMMRRSPGFALTAILSLAVGIGANAAIFSISDALLRRPLPITRPDELHFVAYMGDSIPNYRFSGPAFELFRAQVPEASFAAMSASMRVQVTTDGVERLVDSQLVSGNWFSVLGIEASAGRLFTADDTAVPGGQPRVVLGHEFWRRRFGAAEDAIGSTLIINGLPMTIVGVAPAGFSGLTVGEVVDLWLPVTMQGVLHATGSATTQGNADPSKPWLPQDGIQWLTITARIPASATSAAAHIAAVGRADLERLAAGESDAQARADLSRVSVAPLPGALGLSQLRGTYGTSLTVLAVTALLVLVIACANLASLLFARSAARRQEFALRLSIGARRGRLVRQLLTESVLLSLCAGVLSVLVAAVGGRGLLAVAAVPLTVGVDMRLLGFTFLLSAATGVAFGVGPALWLSRAPIHATLKPAGRVVSGGSARGGLRNAGSGLVVGQVALSLGLLIAATLFVRTLENLMRADPGFQRDGVIAARFDLGLSRIPASAWPDLNRRLIDAARRVPGVTHATLAFSGPLASGRRISGIKIEGEAQRSGRDGQVREDYISGDYFATVRTPRVVGREFTPQDDVHHPLIAIVNETMAKRFFGTANPIGRRFGYDESANVEIVGVARDARIDGPQAPVPALVYYPVDQHPDEPIRRVYVRVEGSAATVDAAAAGLRAAIGATDGRIAVWEVATLDQLSSRFVSSSRLVAQLTVVFGALAVAVACLGLYGTLSYAVSRRTKEMGVRLALGSAPVALCWIVLRDALWLVAVGCVAGIVVAWLGLSSVAALLYGLSPRDPATFAAATAVFVVVAVIASAVPAIRAARVDPLTALRTE